MRGELGRRGGFRPLMHLFPWGGQEGLRTIPWHPLDHQMQAFTKSGVYQAALGAGAG